MTCRRNVELLPQDVISKLRSCVAISSVSQCVEELVLNAVDSCAKNVAVRLDLTFFKIQVVDNGFGIPKDQLELIGERYHTSKCHSLQDLKNLRFNGFRGEALASLRDICAVLEITSRTQDNRTYFKAFHYGRSTEVRLSVDERPSVGTTVTILDFMYNLPVRRKSICMFRDFEYTRRCLECIALVNSNVSFTLRNNQTGETCLNTRRTNSMTSSFRWLFGCEKSLKEVVYQSDEMKIQGFISTSGHSTNELQFLFVNCRLILKTRLHDLVRLVLAKYLNSKSRESSQSISPSTNATSSPKKLSHPIFAFNLLCPFNDYDICFEPRKTLIEFENWDKVTGTVMNVLRSFLQDEGYSFEDDDSYLKASPQSVSPATSKASIDTTNSKNALFSLIIKRPKPRKNKRKNSEQSREPKTLTRTRTTEYESAVLENSQQCNNNLYSTYQKDSKQDAFCQSFQQNKLVNLDESCSKNQFCSKEEFGDVSVPSNIDFTVPLPVALRFNSNPSPLSMIRSRKRKESKLKELRETFEFQKPTKFRTLSTKLKSTHHNAFSDDDDDEESEKGSKKKPPKNKDPFHCQSSTSDIMDFDSLNSHVDINPVCNYPEVKVCDSSSRKSPDDKWSILSQSQEIINATEPFVVPQSSSSVQQGHENEHCNRDDVVSKSSNTSGDHNFFQCLEIGSATRLTPEPNALSSRTSTPGSSYFQSGVVNKYDALFSDNNHMNASVPDKTSVHASVPSSTVVVTQDNSNVEDVSTVSASQILSSTFPGTKPKSDCVSEQQDWFKWQDLDSGNILYINKKTGNSSYVPPILKSMSETPPAQSQWRDGHFFLSHNSTPFLPRPDRKVNNLVESTLASNKSMENLLETWQNPVFKRSDSIEISSTSQHFGKPTIRVYSMVQNYKFFKSMFSKAKVLGQVDCKFIACLVPSSLEEDDEAGEKEGETNLLVLFDQHAVHERIRLEEFTKDLHNNNGEVHTSALESPLSLEVAPETGRLARAYSTQLERMAGLGIESEGDPYSASVSLGRLPTCLLEREASELKNNRPSVLATFARTLLEEQVQKLKETGHLGGAIPKTIHEVLSSRACKGAIKFGDPLNEEKCIQLVRDLSSCQLPFQCAHGRPSVIPVLDMSHITRPLHWKVQRPRLFRLSKMKCKQAV